MKRKLWRENGLSPPPANAGWLTAVTVALTSIARPAFDCAWCEAVAESFEQLVTANRSAPRMRLSRPALRMGDDAPEDAPARMQTLPSESMPRLGPLGGTGGAHTTGESRISVTFPHTQHTDDKDTNHRTSRAPRALRSLDVLMVTSEPAHSSSTHHSIDSAPDLLLNLLNMFVRLA